MNAAAGIRLAGLALLLLAAAPVPVIYSNATLHPETGDVLGLEIAIHAATAVPYAEFTVCEGWCQSVDLVALQPQAKTGHYCFDWSPAVVDAAGKPLPQPRTRVCVQPAGRDLRLEASGGYRYEPQRLKRQAKRFALLVPEGAVRDLRGASALR